MRRLGLWLKQQSRRRAPTPDGFAFVPLRVPCSWRHPLGFRTGNGVCRTPPSHPSAQRGMTQSEARTIDVMRVYSSEVCKLSRGVIATRPSLL
jgi:hypothetical protein